MLDTAPDTLRDVLAHNPNNYAVQLLLPAAIVFKGEM
jgi:hypothetical protein